MSTSSDPRNVERAIRKNTRYVYIETPTNPLMGLTDIAAVSAIAHKRGCEVVVDNTFMSPYFQQPHQVRRRHGDALDHEVPQRPQRRPRRRAGLHHRRTGGEAGVHAEGRRRDLSPFECWLVLRGPRRWPSA